MKTLIAMSAELSTALVGAAGLLIGAILSFVLGKKKVDVSMRDSWRADFEQIVEALRTDNESLRKESKELRQEVSELKVLVETLHKERMALTDEVSNLRKLVNYLESQTQ